MTWQAAFLKRIQDVEDLVDYCADRIEYGRRAEGDPLPAVNLNVTSDDRPDHFKGEQELRMSRVQVDVFADGLTDAIEIAEIAIATVRAPADDVNGYEFQRSGIEGPETSGGQENSIYINRARFDALVWHRKL